MKNQNNKINYAHSLFTTWVNGVISLALLTNVSAAVPLISDTTIGDLSSFEIEIETTSLMATSPLDEGKRRIYVDVTAYSSTPDQTDDTPFITASGHRVRDGIVAANFLPLYTKIKIPELFGEKVFVVEDRMNRRYQNRVDIWMETRSGALKFGLHEGVEIVVL